MKRHYWFAAALLINVLSGSALAQTGNLSPCENDSLYRQLDFWIGEWEVHNAEGKKVGTSSIQRILDGCVIQENWKGESGYIGKSFNFIDPLSGKWRQLWVDNKRGRVEFTGGLEGANIILFAEVERENGDKYRRKMILFNLGPDRVRQFSQRTFDRGKTWHAEYDFTYTRRVPPMD